MEPNIQIYEVDLRGDRSLTVRHLQDDRVPLDGDDAREVIKHLHFLWRFDVRLESIDNDETTAVYKVDDDKLELQLVDGD